MGSPHSYVVLLGIIQVLMGPDAPGASVPLTLGGRVGLTGLGVVEPVLLVGAGVYWLARDLALTLITLSTLAASTFFTVSSSLAFHPPKNEAEPDEIARNAITANRRRAMVLSMQVRKGWALRTSSAVV